MRPQIIEMAETLFFSNGYKATSLQELGDLLQIKPASLYYHFPGGKEEIYLEVLRNRLEKYRLQVYEMRQSSADLEEFLRSFALWFIEQPPMNMSLISQMDMPHLTPRAKGEVMQLVSSSIFAPLRESLAQSTSDLKDFDLNRLVGIYISLLNGMSLAVKQSYTSREGLVDDFIEMMMRGILKPKSGT
ncbi:MAG TPA: TetR/AcrR family transcriptional regulator [Bdellovibrio sp.]